MNMMILAGYGVFLVVLYLVLIYPKTKQAKKIQAMRNALRAGDEVVTIGGMVGKITKVNEEEITLEVSPEKSTIRLKKWAVGSLNEKNLIEKK